VTSRTHPVEDFAPVPDLGLAADLPTTYGTGLTALDDITGGGVRPGDLWVVTGRPGQGRSMLLTQLAGHLALEHRMPTYLVSDRDPASLVAARLHANRTRIPLDHITGNRLTDHDLQRIAKTGHELQLAPLHVLAGSHARHRAVDQLEALARKSPIVTVFDDPDWQAEWDLHEARRLTDRGATVIAGLTRDRLLHRTGDHDTLDPAAGLADLILEVRHDRIHPSGELEPVTEPGRATLTILRNRRGPHYSFSVGFFAHWAAYFDPEPAPALDRLMGSFPPGPGLGAGCD